MIPQLPKAFLGTPIAHRGLHDKNKGRPENSRASVRAAIEAGYGIEIDLQMSSDGQALVFHDYDMTRLTGQSGPVRQLTAVQAAGRALAHGDGEGIPTLPEILELIAGRTHLLIELKDQDGGMGADIGLLERDTAKALREYRGPVAVMSFNPHSVAALAELAPDLPRGLVTSSYRSSEWFLPQATCDKLRGIPDFDRVGASFISHEVEDLERPRVAELKARGVPVLCWTVKSPEQETEARKVADNVTFEGYMA